MKWEYRIESVTVTNRFGSKRQAKEFDVLHEKLNELGREGWEMVSYESIPMTGSISKKVHDYYYLVFFKRRVE